MVAFAQVTGTKWDGVTMTGKQAFDSVLMEWHGSHAQLSRRLGKTSGYIGSYRAHGKTPGVDTFAAIARACGYRLQLVAWDGRTITIGPDDTAHE